MTLTMVVLLLITGALWWLVDLPVAVAFFVVMVLIGYIRSKRQSPTVVDAQPSQQPDEDGDYGDTRYRHSIHEDDYNQGGRMK